MKSFRLIILTLFLMPGLICNEAIAATVTSALEAPIAAKSPLVLAATNIPVTEKYAPNELIDQFHYDSQIPLDIREQKLPDKYGISVFDISFASVNNKRVDAFLLLPRGKGPFPVVVFVHWGFGSRSQFLEEANLLAQFGVASLLVNSPFGDSKDHFIQTVINLRRAVDLLVSYQLIDPVRIGYVGHSWGGTLGGILAGVETRIKAYVLIAGFPSYAEYANRKDLEQFAGVLYVGHSSPAALMFQFADEDAFVSREAGERYFNAGGEPKIMRWYDHTTHKFKNEKAQLDRLEWLRKKLN